MSVFDFNVTQIQPFMADQRVQTIYWIPSGLANTVDQPGMLGSIPPSAVANLAVGESVSVNNILSWPAFLPFSVARPLLVSSTGDWQDFSFTFTYKNAYGIWMVGVLANGPNNAQGVALPGPTGTVPVLNDTYLYPQYLYDLTITRNANVNVPADPILLDWANEGITKRMDLQDSQRYFGTSLQVLNIDECDGVATVTKYWAHQDIYPSMIQNLAVQYPMHAFVKTFANTLETAIVDGSTVPTSFLFANELMSPLQNGAPPPAPLDPSFLVPGMNTVPAGETVAKIVQIPYAVSHVWLEIDSTNTSPLLINILQNAVAR
jgi:hypothetical protein